MLKMGMLYTKVTTPNMGNGTSLTSNAWLTGGATPAALPAPVLIVTGKGVALATDDAPPERTKGPGIVDANGTSGGRVAATAAAAAAAAAAFAFEGRGRLPPEP